MFDIATLFTLIMFVFLFIECLLSEQKCSSIDCKLGFQNLAFMFFGLGIMVLLYSVYMYIENYCKRSSKSLKIE